MPTAATTTAPVILIVDDYRDTCDMYAAYLEFAGFRPLQASDGYEALQLAQARRPDVILMDLSLPGLDGYEVTRRLKADPATRDIPVIALTANATARQFDELVAQGFDDLITKPCLPDALADELGRLIRRARRGDAPSVAA